MIAVPFIIENFLDFAVLFAGIWLIKKLFRNKMSARLHFLIWGVAVLKLLIPFGLPSAASPWAWMGAQAAPAAVQNNYEYVPSAAEESPVYENAVSGDTGNIVSGGQTLPAMNEGSADVPAPSTPVRIDWSIVIVSVWLSGIAARLAWLGLKSRKFRKKLLINEISPPLWVKECFDSCLREACVKKEIRLVIQDAFSTPAVIGFKKPVLILPQKMLQDGNRERLRHVIVHEMAHIIRKDTLVVSLLNILNAVYWFNPLVWLCFKMVRKDIETACDCMAIRTLGKVKRQSYIKTVLQFAGRNDSPWLRAAMGINNGQRNMERRIRGMFLKTRTKPLIKVPVVILACLLAFACFTTACNPAAGEPVPGESGGNHPAVDLHWAPKPPVSYKVSEHWSETYQNGKPKMIIDTGVYVPDVNEYPVVKVEQANFTQQRVDELVNYFAKGKQLYLPHVMTKADYQRQLDEVKRGELVDGVYVDSGWTLDEVKQTEEKMASAPEDSPIIYTDTTLTYERDFETGKEITETGRNFLSVLFDNGNGREAHISISNLVEWQGTYGSDGEQSRPTYFFYSTGEAGFVITESMYQNICETEEETGYIGAGELFGKVKVTPEEAIAQADNVINGLGINDMILIGTEKYVTPGAPDKCGYEVQYARESGGIAGYVPESYGWSNSEEPPMYSPPFFEEMLIIRVSKDGLESLIWRNCAKAVETVNENAELLPFESIKQALKERIIYKTRFNGGLGRVNYAVNVTSAELRMGYIDIKGNAKQALMVPVWFFRTQETWTLGGETVMGNETVYKFNAIDGGAIEWRP